MTQPEKDQQFARFFSRTTKYLKHVPIVDRLIGGMGATLFPDGWDVAPAGSENVGQWFEFEGDPGLLNRLPVPRLYKSVGVMAVRKSEMRSMLAIHEGARSAVAVRLGESAVVVGPLAEGASFPEHPDEVDRLLVAGGIGHEALVAQPVVWLPEPWAADQQRMLSLESAEAIGKMSRAEARPYLGGFI